MSEIDRAVTIRSRLERAARLVGLLRDWVEAIRFGRRLEQLQRKAAEASQGFRPQYHLRAAQVAGSLGRHSEALRLYGESIDGYLEAGRGRAAEVVCRQLLEDYPHVVRARRTLTLLALARDDVDSALLLLREYAARSRQSPEPLVLLKSLRIFALISESDEVRAAAITELRAMGDEEGVRRLSGDAVAPAAFNGLGVWSQAIQAARLGPDAIRQLAI